MQTNDVEYSKLACWAHVVPFLAWIVLMIMLDVQTGGTYAIRTGAGLALLLYFRPWRWYARPSLKEVPLAVVAGLVVFIVWIFPETGWMPAGLGEAYLRWAVMPWGELPEVVEASPYAPETAGWLLVGIRLLGSALVIALIEEFFWRGFLYRWLQGKHFEERDLSSWHAGYFFAVAIVFGFEHNRWLVGIIAGLVYGWLMIRTKSIWPAAIAHIVTNLLLGIYVLSRGAYQFW